jgi:hypothetical protein
LAVGAAQALPFSDSLARRDRLDVAKLAKDLEVHVAR